MNIDFTHLAINFLTVTAPLILYFWKRGDETRKVQDKRHEQNQKMLEELIEERKYFQLHEHLERNGTLTVEGIRKKNGR